MATKEKQLKEPLFHVAKRSDISLARAMLFRVIAVVAAILLCSFLSIFLIGADPIEFLVTMFEGAIGTPRNIWKLFKDSAVLLCIEQPLD